MARVVGIGIQDFEKRGFIFMNRQENKKNAYRTLGISENAGEDEIKRAYRMLCKRFHPDLNASPEALQNYLKVQQAYEIVMQAKKEEKVCWKKESPADIKQRKILGAGRTSYRRYEDMQQRADQSRKLERERKTYLQEREEKRKRNLKEQMKLRKLPSEKEAEKREKIAMRKEAERIAKIIQRLMEMSDQ